MHYTEHRLSSGVRLIHRPSTSSVGYLGIAIGVGSRHEGRGELGLAHFIEHMLFKGTRLRSSQQIIRRLEEVGGELNAYTSKEETILYASFPIEYAYRTLQLLSDLVLNSQFTPEELSKEQTVVLDELASYEDSPSELIWDEFEDILFKGHPLGHNILGTKHSVQGFSQKRCQAFFKRHYRLDNMLLFALGAFDVERLKTEAELRLRGIRSEGKPAMPIVPTFDEFRAGNLPRQVVRLKDTHQRHIIIGGHAYAMHDERRLPLSLLSNLLGGSAMSSRLNMALRERTGLVYHVECNYTAYRDTGLIAIYLGCAPHHTQEAIALVEAELRRMMEQSLTPEELAQYKRQIRGQMIVASDGAEHTFLSMGKAYLHHGKVDTLEEVMAKIDRITSEELLQVAREVLDPRLMYRLIYK